MFINLINTIFIVMGKTMVQRNRLVIYVSLFLILPVMGLVNNNQPIDSLSEEIQHFNESLIPNVETAFPGLTTDNYSRIAKHDTCLRGTGTCIEIVDDIAYVGYRSEGLMIVDIEHPYTPSILSIYPIHSIIAMEIVGNYAYIIGGWDNQYGTLKIIDIYDPIKPQLVGTYSGVFAYDLAIIGPYAYLAAGTNGLRIINITNPTNPVLISQHKDGSSNSIAIHINANYYALTAEAEGGMRIYDCTNITNPILLGEHIGEGFNCLDIVASKNYAYLATDTAGFIIININDYENPSYHDQIEDKSISKIKIVGTTGYFVFDTSGVKIYNVRNFDNPKLVNTIGQSDITDICYYNDYLFVTKENDPLEIFDIGTANSEESISLISEGLAYTDMIIYEDIAIVATGTRDIVIYDLSDILNPTIKMKFEADSKVFDLMIDGSRVYFFDEYQRMNVLEIINSDHFSMHGNVYSNTLHALDEFFIEDNIAYLMYNQETLIILNVTNLNDIVELGDIFLDTYVYDIFYENNYVYLNSLPHFSLERHLLKVNVTQLDNPVLCANYSLKGFDFYIMIYDFQVSDDLIFMIDTLELKIIKINATNELQLLSIYDLDAFSYNDKHITINDNYTYLTSAVGGLEVLNTSNPSQPIKLGQFSDNRDVDCTAACLSENQYFYATDTGGIEIISKDHDSDGLADYLETNVYSTNPYSEDTDGDLLTDGYEVYYYHSDPTSLDSDSDTLSDTDEVFLYNTNPALADTDHDLISDADEILAGSDPLNPNDPNINYTITDYIGLPEQFLFSTVFFVMMMCLFLQRISRKRINLYQK